ncbi:MAG: hypothetical protein ACLT3Y_02215 [Ruminococcus callidus]
MNFYEAKVAGNAMTFSDGSKMQLPKSVVAKLNGRQGTLVLAFVVRTSSWIRRIWIFTRIISCLQRWIV